MNRSYRSSLFPPYLQVLAWCIILTIVTIVPVGAIPAFPHIFCGDVTINGIPVPDGTRVSADVDQGTIIIDSEAQNPVETVDGSYGKGDGYPLLVQGDIPDGAIITFYVNDMNTGRTAIFRSGDGPSTMDLAINTPPTANFSMNRTSGYVPIVVQFSDLSTGNPTSWSWDFGDGYRSSLQNPVHTYSAPGVYTVHLTVQNPIDRDEHEKKNCLSILLKGDLNQNGVVDIGDVAKVAHMAARLVPVDYEADFNGDGVIDAADAALIAYYYVGWIRSL